MVDVYVTVETVFYKYVISNVLYIYRNLLNQHVIVNICIYNFMMSILFSCNEPRYCEISITISISSWILFSSYLLKFIFDDCACNHHVCR